MIFFDRFDALCKQNNTSVNAVAKVIGVSSGSVTAWKNGTEPRLSAATKVADYFDVSADYLLGKTDDPTPADKKNTPLEEMDSKEVLKLALIKEGIIPADREMTQEERNALFAMCEAFFNRQNEQGTQS